MVRFQRWQKITALWALLLLAAAAAGPARAAEDVETLVVPVGETGIISVKGLERVAIADPLVAEVVVATAQEVLVNGKKVGRTSLHIWEGGRRRSFLVKVEANLEATVEEITRALADPAVRVRAEGGKVLLEGTVPDQGASERAEKIARAFSAEVINLLRWESGSADPSAKAEAEKEAARKAAERENLPARVEKAIGVPTVRVSLVGDVLLVDGTVPDKNAGERAKTIAEALAAGVVGKVSFTLGIASPEPPQVLLQVKVMEISNDSLNQLGITWGGMTRSSDGSQRYFDPGVNWVGELAIDGPWGRLSEVIGQIDAMLKEGSAKLLAAPSILTRSGKEAEFLAGGEFPVVVYEQERYTIYWKEYGVKLSMRPEVQSDEAILVHLKPEVSTLDWANGAKLSNGIFPALRTRRAAADVRLRDGATLVIGGLLSSEEAKNSQGLPLLSKLPILGHLFASKGFRSGKTQLVIFVTPHLIRDGESPTAEEVMNPPEKLPEGPPGQPAEQPTVRVGH
ncbi:MAG: pilus assembly protein N-terminal domain-containing protein [Bacillota bacterium]|nr:pilus assembly protein N-terminal domain-containing protein [Bacillota bacterium]